MNLGSRPQAILAPLERRTCSYSALQLAIEGVGICSRDEVSTGAVAAAAEGGLTGPLTGDFFIVHDAEVDHRWAIGGPSDGYQEKRLIRESLEDIDVLHARILYRRPKNHFT